MLEALQWEYNAFVTLTYSDENLPRDGNIKAEELRNFIKRLRKRYATENLTFRYYACGEYGEKSNRPHYHLALFNYASCFEGSQFSDGEHGCQCRSCSMVYQSWRQGRIQVGTLTQESAAYIAGYVTKKWLLSEDSRTAPFSRMSNKPGIGAGAMDDVASALLMAEFKGEDVPNQLLHGQKRWPLGRYLVRRLRERMGREKNAPEATLDKMDQAMSEMRETAFENSSSFKEEIVNRGVTRRASLEFWQSIRDQGKSL